MPSLLRLKYETDDTRSQTRTQIILITVLVPDIIVAPVVAFDRECYRLGYGGGYFDRTLAALRNGPAVLRA